MVQTKPENFQVRLANSDQELRAAQRLRYDVFVKELGGDGPMVDHQAMLERDRFDGHCDHLLVFDNDVETPVGAYRLMRDCVARDAEGFYSASEYDLSVLKNSGRRILELGRSCLHPDYRTGLAMHHLWAGLAAYIDQHKIEVLFGVASFHGTDATALAAPLSLLHHRHLAPPSLRVRARGSAFQRMDLIPEDQIDRRAAMVQMPSLMKAYLRLGGCVGEGAFVDHAFNTTDVCLVLDVTRLSPQQSRLFQARGT